MPWTVTLEDENNTVLYTLAQEFTHPFLMAPGYLQTTTLLKYLDPYGDTVFNTVQMNDLIIDLRQLAKHGEEQQIEELIRLAVRCREETHTYLTFYGD